MNTIEFKKTCKHAIIPTKAHATDSGFDLYAVGGYEIPAGGRALVSTGIAIGLPPGYEAHVRPRSGVTSKTSARVQFGTVDNSYRGEIKVMVDNIQQQPRETFKGWLKRLFGMMETAESEDFVSISHGAKIAQLVVAPLPEFEGIEVTSLSEGERGENGFGSTGGF